MNPSWFLNTSTELALAMHNPAFWDDYTEEREMTKKETKTKTNELKKMVNPTRIIHSGPATIVFWDNGTKTVVKLSDNDWFDEYDAFCAAFAIKMFGSNSRVKKMIDRISEVRY